MSERFKMTVADALRAAAARLEPVTGSGRLDATLLLEHVTGEERVAFVRDGERALGADAQRRLDALVARRLGGVPIAYLTGSAGFYGRTFAVDERVLVPRPETEHLVEAAVGELRERAAGAVSVADVGTGSGAIAITVALELSAAGVFATDVSADALAVARDNAARHGVVQRCTFVQGDLAAPLHRFGPFDCILANLPYVPSAAIPAEPDPVAYEPRLALDGGRDGLDLYRKLLGQIGVLAGPHTVVFFEAAPPTIRPLSAAIAAAFPHAAVTVGTDYGGRERYVRFSPA